MILNKIALQSLITAARNQKDTHVSLGLILGFPDLPIRVLIEELERAIAQNCGTFSVDTDGRTVTVQATNNSRSFTMQVAPR